VRALASSLVIDFAGHVTLVTGAGRGLGRAYARLLAERGATVIVHDAGVGVDGAGEDLSVADAVVTEIRTQGGTAAAAYEDLGEREGCRALVERVLRRFGKVDALVHSAGLVIRAPIDEIDEARWRRSQSVNVDAAFWLLQAVVPGMLERRYGRIVLTTSGYGLGPADDVLDLVAYCSTKAAQYGLMNGLAWAAADGVFVNSVAPIAATRIYSRPVEPGELSPEQAAPGVVFLASPACDVSGIVLRAEGGRFAVAGYDRGSGVDFGRMPVTPEKVAQCWPDIAR
jgi:NAD(P)-dependent dehydrogenase (short-subunit alcohol dehydrogenase family)